MRRNLNLPALFLSALAMGVWIGASWHSAAQPISFASSETSCKACCVFADVLCKSGKASKKQSVSAPKSIGHSECGACFAGALVQDAPTARRALSIHVSAPDATVPTLKIVRLSAQSHAHPPERGPPA